MSNLIERNLAVIIGIDNYSKGVNPLNNAVKDAEEIAKVLKEKHDYEVRWQLLNEEANLNELVKLLEKTLPQEIKDNDRLIFYFAGHGKTVQGDDGPTGYLIPQDGEKGNSNTFLAMNKLHDLLINLQCRHFLGIFDCCFAGALRWSITRASDQPEDEQLCKEQYDYYLKNSVWQVILSAAYDEEAYDGYINTERGESQYRPGHSPFAAALLNALEKGEADVFPQPTSNTPKGDGIITAAELHAYLNKEIEPITANKKPQTPGLYCLKKHEKGEFLFDTPNHPKNWRKAPKLDETTNPYKSLASFEEKDEDYFFGRDVVIEDLYKGVSKNTFTAVIGASGSGKSSLVKAGLIPKLKKENWQIINSIRPGKSPFEELKKSLIASKLITANTANQEIGKTLIDSLNQNQNKLLLLIDQSEELITLCPNEDEAKEFLKQIVNATTNSSDQLRVVLTLRSDFEPQFQKYLPENFSEIKWKEIVFNIPMMSREELREAIEKPAEKRVFYFKPHSLIDDLINEVYNTLGGLPLLSFALSELYLKYLQRQEKAQERGENIDRAITKNEDYKELGGVSVALSHRADKVYNDLVSKSPNPTDKEKIEQIIKNVMLRMVTFGGGNLARRRVPMSELNYPQVRNEKVQDVIKTFTDARLLVTYKDKDTKGNETQYVEPAHDALVTRWQKLQEWQNPEDLALQRRLTSQAEDWQEQKQQEQKQQEQKQQKQRLIISRATKIIISAEPGLDWIARRIYSGEILLEQTKNLVLQLWKRQENEKGNNTIKPKQFLWHNDPYLDVLDKQLKSGKDWFNELEANFVWRSIIWQRIDTNWFRFLTIGIIFGLSWLTYSAVIGQREAQLGRINASRQSAESSLGTNRDLESVRQILRAGKPLKGETFDNWLFFKLFQQDTELMQHQARVKATLQKVFYRVRERNRLQLDRAGVYGMAFHPNQDILATVGDKNTIRVWKTDGDKVEQIEQFPGDSGYRLGFVNYGENNYCVVGKLKNNLKLVNFGNKDKIKLWNIQENGKVDFSSGVNLSIPNLEQKSIYRVVLSPNGQFLAVLFNNPDGFNKLFSIKMWNIDYTNFRIKNEKCNVSYSPINNEELQKINTLSVAFSSKGNLMATFENDRVTLWNTSGKKLYDIETNQKDIQRVAFSPDDKQLATVGKDSNVQQWKIETEQNSQGQVTKIKDVQQNNSFSTPQKVIYNVAYNRDGQKLATIGEDSILKIWDSSGKQSTPIQPLEGFLPDTQLKSLAFSLDGKQLATLVGNNTVRLWDMFGNSVARFVTDENNLTTVSFSKDGKSIATITESGKIQWLDNLGNNTRSPLKTNLEKIKIKSIAFSPNGKQAAIVDKSGFVRLLNIANNKLNLLEVKDGKHTKENIFESVAFSPDGQLLATGTQNGQVWFWDTSGQQVGQFNTRPKKVSNIAFSPDGKQIATAEDNDILNIWSISRLNPQKNIQVNFLNGFKTYQQVISSIAFNPWDGKELVTGGQDGTVRVWNISNNQPMQFSIGETSVNNLAFDSDSKILATVNQNNKIQLWNVLDDGSVRIRDISNTELYQFQENLQIRTSKVFFSPDRQKLAIITTDNTVSLWDISGKKLSELPQQKNTIKSVSFSNDVNWLAFKGENDTVNLWKIKDNLLQTLPPEKNKSDENISSILLSPNGKLLVIAGNKGRVKIWNTSSLNKQQDEFQTQQEKITSMTFSRDGEQLATAGADGTLRLWDTFGNEIRAIKTDQNNISRIIFSADSKQIATIGKTATIKSTLKLWDTLSGERIQQFSSESKDVSSADFSFDGKYLAIGANQGTVSLWRVGTTDDLLVEICRLVHGYLQNNADVDQSDRQLCSNVPIPIGTENLSRGEKILVREVSNPDKLDGI